MSSHTTHPASPFQKKDDSVISRMRAFEKRFEPETDTRTLLQELEATQRELERKHQELKVAQRALEESQKHYSHLYDYAPAGYMILSESGIVHECNLTAAGLIRINRDALIGRSLLPWISISELDLFLMHLRQCRIKGETTSSLLHLKRQDKTKVPVEVLSIPYFDPTKGELLFRTAILDLTEKKNKEDHLDRFFILSNELLCIGGTDGFFKRVNSTWERVLGYSADELLSRPFFELVHPDDQKNVWTQIKKLTRGHQRTITCQTRILKKDQTWMWLEWNAVLFGKYFYGAARDVGQSVDMAQNITALKQMEESMKEAIGNLEREKTMREHFVFALTHDLRTPLTAAKLCAQLVARDGRDPIVLTRVSERIIRNIDRMDRMILDLLDANRIKAGQQVALKLNECNLKSVAETILNEALNVHGDRFVLDCKYDVYGFWDQSGLRRVIENLIQNAVKYGDPKTKVSLKIKDRKDIVEISIQNWGNPIDPEDLKNIFQQFKRTAAAENGRQKGWGLGLTLVKGIIEAHGGDVQVESTAEAGTTFIIGLPRKRPG